MRYNNCHIRSEVGVMQFSAESALHHVLKGSRLLLLKPGACAEGAASASLVLRVWLFANGLAHVVRLIAIGLLLAVFGAASLRHRPPREVLML